MKRIIYFFCVIWIIIYPSLGICQSIITDPVSTGTSLDAINTVVADLMKKGIWQFNLRDDYFNFRSFTDEQLLRYAIQTGREIETNTSLNFPSLTVAYGIADSLAVGINLPYFKLTGIRSGNLEELDDHLIPLIINAGNSQGLSDLNLYAQWLFFNNQNYKLSSMLVLGTVIPTGKTDLRDKHGNLFSPNDQPGHGAWAPFIGIAVTHKREKDLFSMDFFVTKNFEGAQKANFGNIYDYDFAFVHSLYQANSHFSLSGILEINGEYLPKIIEDGNPDPDTGGSLILLSPGLRMNIKDNIFPFLAVGFPIIQRLNGFQPEIKYSIATGFDAHFA